MSASPALDGFNAVLKHTPVAYLDRARAYPFLKWAGGKRSLVPEIVKVLPEQFGTYWEPFCGGGAVFFALDSRITRAALSDSNIDLITTYATLKKDVGAVIAQLEKHAAEHSRPYYNKIREEGQTYQDPVQVAARFIYLNKTCYNGLYRVNSKGHFNVPMGSYKNPTICDTDNLQAVAQVLQKATIKARSFEKIKPKAGDLVYCDPPYDATFTGYTSSGFNETAQQALRDQCRAWSQAGVHVILSNSDTPLIRSLYAEFRRVPVAAARNINCQGNGREKVTELLICGD